MSALVSIIVPCFKQAQYLNEALESVLNQTYTNWECIIVNDGSPDNTEEIAKKWVAKDNRFQYYGKENGGVSSARNLGLDKIKGQYIQFLDADDLIALNKLELSLHQLNSPENTNEKACISNFRMFTDSPQKTTGPYCNLNPQLFNLEGLLYQWNDTFSIPIHCGFFEASLFEAVRFPENLTAQEDWIVWVNLFRQMSAALFIDKPLALYRKNNASRTMTKSLYEDQIKAYEYFKHHLTEYQFHKLSITLISRYFISAENLKLTLHAVKYSNTYRTGLFIKKVLKKLGILKPCRDLFRSVFKNSNS